MISWKDEHNACIRMYIRVYTDVDTKNYRPGDGGVLYMDREAVEDGG